MSRYIDADALMTELQKDADAFDDEADDARKNAQNYTDGDLYSLMGRTDGIRDAMMEVYDAPSIDLVRCKECKWLRYCETEDLDLYLDCDKPDGGGIPQNEDWFCADGEREGE